MTTTAEARAILSTSQKVLDLALSQRQLSGDGCGDAAQALAADEDFRKDSLRCFVRCFELLSLSGQLKRREVEEEQVCATSPFGPRFGAPFWRSWLHVVY